LLWIAGQQQEVVAHLRRILLLACDISPRI
jgi:hypothetical protein